MIILILIFFILGYLMISLEHQINIDKAASALIIGAICWTIYAIQPNANHELINEELVKHFGDIASILFFLLGALIIVEIIEESNGFLIIEKILKTRNKGNLLLLITLITFFFSAILDNLTTTIVMITICSKLLTIREDKLYFASMIVIAANAGGAWSPLGDVTTTMLWVGQRITTVEIIKTTFLPSVISIIIPLIFIYKRFKNKFIPNITEPEIKNKAGEKILYLSIGLFIFVPAFKVYTHLPPLIGMLIAVAVIWIYISFLNISNRKKDLPTISILRAFQKIDLSTILFFLGILLAVACLESVGILNNLANYLQSNIDSPKTIAIILGALSSIVDNVPLVAASLSMFPLSEFPLDDSFWTLLALTTGIGGSMIIIGSAAGVAAMGMEKIKFIWYLKKISWLVFLGYICGVVSFLLLN